MRLNKDRRDAAPRLYTVTGFSLEGGSGLDRGASTPPGEEQGGHRALPPSGEVTVAQLINAIKGNDPQFDTGKGAAAPAGGMDTDGVRQAIANTRLKWGRSAPRVEVVQSVTELPEGIQDAVAEGEGAAPAGASSGATVYLVADNLRGPENTQRILAHEAVGHYGLETMLGEEEFAHLQDRVQVLKDSGEERIADLAAEVHRRYGDLDQATESAEILAVMAERGIRHPLLSRAIAAVRRFLRRMGLTVQFSRTEVEALIANAGRYLEGNQLNKAKVRARFARQEDEDPVLAEVREMVGRKPDSLRERLTGLTDNVKDTFEQGFFDQFHGLLRAEKTVMGEDWDKASSAYVQTRMTTSLPAQVHVALSNGAPRWDGHVVTWNPETKGLLDIFGMVQENLEDWGLYLVGRRAQRLKQEDREHYFTQEQIDRMVALGEEHPEFEQAAEEWQTYNNALLDFAVEAGLIDAKAAEVWKSYADYVPFYRLVEADHVEGPSGGRKGIVGRSADIRALEGGTARLNSPIENMLMNTAHLLREAVANQAARQAVNNLEGSAFLTETESAAERQTTKLQEARNLLEQAGGDPSTVPQEVLREIQRLKRWPEPRGRDVVKVMDGGQPRYFRVHDALLYRALTNINKEAWGKWMGAMRAPKRFLTQMVTADPAFMARNFIRDSTQAFVLARDPMKPVVGSFKGIVDAWRHDDFLMRIWAAGGGFHGGYINAHDPQALESEVNSMLAQRGIGRDTIIATPRKLWDQWQDFSSAFENANRLSVGRAAYQRALANGRSERDAMQIAAYEAKDFMDFSMRGDWKMVQFLVETVPFMGARIQGLHRLGRGALEDPRGFAKKGGLVMLAAVALYLKYRDDERYRELPDWDKNTYFHFWLGEKHFRIPKPFEVGAIFGTIPELLTEAILPQDGPESRELGENLLWTLRETFNLGTIEVGGVPLPAPQLFAPGLEVAMNRNTFLDMPIEGVGDRGKLPEARYDYRTSDTARAIGQGVGLSPKKIEHLLQGYTGTIGTYALGVSDMIMRRTMDYPAPPASEPEDWPVVSAFYRGTGPAKGSKWQTDFYDLFQEVDQVYATIQQYRRERSDERAMALVEKNRDELMKRGALRMVHRHAQAINNRIERIHQDRRMSPEEKRERVNKLIDRKNQLFRRSMERLDEDL